MLILNHSEPLPLLHLCTARVGALLRDQYYYPVGKAKAYANPFRFVPPEVINELFEMVMRAHKKTRALITNMLRPLLTSGRLTRMVFGHRELTEQDLIGIFDELVTRALYVRKISFLPLIYSDEGFPGKPLFIRAVNNFLLKCENIEHLNIPTTIFESKLINKLPKLKILEIISARGKKLRKLTMKLPHFNLTHVRICCSPVPSDILVTLLMYCPNLISLKNNISEALQVLQSKQLSGGTSRKVYGLQEYVLHNTALDIASETCPKTKVLCLCFRTKYLRQQLSNFDGLKSVESLEVYWDTYDQPTASLNYHPVLDHLFKCMGQGLKNLTLDCTRVDFEALGMFCPNLVSLKVYFEHSDDIRNPLVSCFPKLESLYLLTVHEYGRIDSEVLEYFCHGSKQLSELTLYSIECLTDRLLDSLLRRNGLQNLKKLYLESCSLTERGVRMLLEKCCRLEKIFISSILLSKYETVLQIIQDFYPCARSPIRRHGTLLNSYPYEKRPSRSRKRSLPE